MHPTHLFGIASVGDLHPDVLLAPLSAANFDADRFRRLQTTSAAGATPAENAGRLSNFDFIISEFLAAGMTIEGGGGGGGGGGACRASLCCERGGCT